VVRFVKQALRGAGGSLRRPNAHLAYTDHPQPTWTHTVYVNRHGQVEVDAYSVAGEDHNLGFHYPDWAQLAIQFFGLTTDHDHE